MLYKFKSQACGDVIMLDVNARQVLEAMGKGDAARQPKGIVEPADMAAALGHLAEAVARDEARRAQAAKVKPEEDRGHVRHANTVDGITLRQRAAPMVDMLKRSLAEKKPIVWGV